MTEINEKLPNGEFNDINDNIKPANTDKDNKYDLGKFKDPSELMKAYKELEREFTRRSQKLRELEMKKSTSDWKERLDKFLEKTPSARPFEKEMTEQIELDPSLKEENGCAETALVRALADKFATPEEMLSDGQFLNKYVLDSPKVKDAVIGRFLKEANESAPPVTLTTGGRNCATPPRLPKTLEEAGAMFLKILK